MLFHNYNPFLVAVHKVTRVGVLYVHFTHAKGFPFSLITAVRYSVMRRLILVYTRMTVSKAVLTCL